MRNILSIMFKDIQHTDHLVNFIENKFRKVKKIHMDILQCNLTVTAPHQQRRNNNPKTVTINARVPGKTLTVKRVTNPREGQDLYAAISDAFAALELQASSRSSSKINYRNFRKSSWLDAQQVAV